MHSAATEINHQLVDTCYKTHLTKLHSKDLQKRIYITVEICDNFMQVYT